jgi:hypothetical protein
MSIEQRAPADLIRAAKSWRAKVIKDMFEQEKRGLVHDVLVEEGTVVLLARFQGESESRCVSLEPQGDGHFLSPNDPRARYRPLSAREQAELQGARRAA